MIATSTAAEEEEEDPGTLPVTLGTYGILDMPLVLGHSC